MGCGASAPASPDKEAAESPVCETEAPATTWATKTSPDGGLGSDISHFTPPSKATQGGSSLHQARRDENVILLDAEDSDGIEFIQETEQKQPARRQPSAANGQEPPEAAESEMLRQPLVEQKPLSKQQQEEAAKLAERRKRFDNQRYHEQRSADVSPFDMPRAVNPGPVRKEPTNGYPTNTDKMLALNATDVGRKEPDTLQGDCLPGGVFDDDEIKQAPQKSSCRHEQHDEVRSTGFNEEEVMLMKEIEDGFDD